MEFDSSKYKVQKLPNLLLVHWVINPGLAVNELVLGQRLPRVMLTDKAQDIDYVPCPHCKAMNDADLWSGKNSFGHWFGIICPECHQKIPSLLNLTSLLVLFFTFPIWIWLRLWGEQKWLEKEKKRFVFSSTKKAKKNRFENFKIGLLFGLFMFCVISLDRYLDDRLNPESMLAYAFICIVGAMIFGALMDIPSFKRRS
jgi:hypothetical protein